MSAVLRTVSMDRRPGEVGRDTMRVRGITIERGIPIPTSNRLSALTEALIALQVGDSILWDTPATNHRSYVLRHYKDRRFKAHRVAGKFRIWRTK